jgi:hypothetical protein
MNHIGKLNVQRRTGTMTSRQQRFKFHTTEPKQSSKPRTYATIHLAGAWGAYPRAGGFRAAVHRGGGMHE